MPSPQRVLSDGVGDWSDLRPSLLFHPASLVTFVGATPGVLYRNGSRQLLGRYTITQTLPGNSAWLNWYRLPFPSSSQVRVSTVSIRVGGEWKSLVPLYNVVAMLHAPHWTLRSDGLWQAPIDLVYPTSVYDAEGNGYYQVDELERLGDNRYYIHSGDRVIIARKPGLLMDGLRTSPTLEVFERVYPRADGAIVSRWKPAQSWCFLMYPDGECLRPVAVEGNVWRFSSSLRLQSAVMRYYVMNTYCLFEDVLEVFTEQCDQIVVRYDTSDESEVSPFYSYFLQYVTSEQSLVCAVEPGWRSTSPPSVTGVLPERIQIDPLAESPSLSNGGYLVVGCRVLSSQGGGVPSLQVRFSCDAQDVEPIMDQNYTDMHGYTCGVFRIGKSAPQKVTVTASLTAYPVSAQREFTLRESPSFTPCHHVVWDRVITDDEYDMLCFYFLDSEGAPPEVGEATVRSIDGQRFRLVGEEHWVNRATVSLAELPTPGLVVLQVPKSPVRLELSLSSFNRNGRNKTVLYVEGG